MSQDIATELKALKLYLTERHPCSYLSDRIATTAFVDPTIAIDTGVYSNLSRMGFRRSGRYFYTPRCELCSACIPVRIPVKRFRPSRSQRRCINRNSTVAVRQRSLAELDPAEHYPLYASYISERHRDGDMYPPTEEQFQDFIATGHPSTSMLEFRTDNGTLIANAITDRLDDGLSAIYTYFDPDWSDRGIGTLAILRQIELARQLDLNYLYLGYWISACRKMNYKTRFRPLELYNHGRWSEIS